MSMTGTDATADCAEPGRAMFLEHVGRYFSVAPQLAPLPPGTACGICSRTSARLWLTASGEASCLAQQTITPKRAARTSVEHPPEPADDPRGMTNMGDGNMVVAGPHRALIVTKLLPDLRPPPELEVAFSAKGSIRDARLALLRNPPPPPFVAVVFGKSARFRAEVTVDASRIIMNGPEPQIMDRARLVALLALAKRIGGKEILEMVALRHRLAGGDGHRRDHAQKAEDQAALLSMRASKAMTPAEFRGLPSPRSAETTFLRQNV